MSKLGGGFWAAGSSSDEASSSSDSDSDNGAAIVQTGRTTGRFQMSGSSSESEEVVRVAKSKQDRAWEDVQTCVTKIRNSMKTSDWSSTEEHWKECCRKMETSKKRIQEKGIPPFYVKLLVDMEDTLQTLTKENFRKMKAAVGKAAANLKTIIKKHNVAYATDIAECRENPSKYESDNGDSSSDDSSSDSDSDDSDSDSDEDEKPAAKPKAVAKAPKTKAVEESDEDSEDSLFGNESDSSDSDSSDGEAGMDGRPELLGRARWLKKAEVAVVKKAVRVQGVAKPKGGDDAKAATAQLRKIPQVAEVALTEEELQRKLGELMSSRGRKGTDPREVLRKLEVLTRGARKFGSKVEIPILMHLVSAMYDASRGIDDYMDVQQWRTCSRCLTRITALLDANKMLSLGQMSAEDATDLLVKTQQTALMAAKKKAQAQEEKDEEEKAPVDPNIISCVGTLGSFVQRLEDEYTKALQQINPHTSEYVARLSDEGSLIQLAEAVYDYYRRVGDHTAAAAVALLHVEHIYYKHDTVAKAVCRAHAFNTKWGRFADIHPSCTSKMVAVSAQQRDVTITHPATFSGYPVVEVPATNPAGTIAALTQFIFKHADERIKTRALLCSVYHHALHDRFYRARDLFLISHIQDVIDKADIKTQILYNRVMASLGLSAFREGLIQKAHDCLQNICSGRPLQVRELLAQGQARWTDKDPEQERIERRRLIPYHMHINPDLLDSCHLTCAMLLELPYMARGMTAVNPVNQNVVSRQFRKFMQNYNRQVFTGPPENTREHVMAAAKSMVSGDWQKACNFILGMEVWNLIPNDGGAKVKAMLNTKLKEEAVRTYLLSNGVSAYSSVSLAHLCETFHTQPEPTRRIVSRMIFNKEISAAWEADGTLVLHKVDPSPTQALAVKVAEKLAVLVDTNERLLDPLNGGQMFGNRDEWNRDGRRQWQGHKDDGRENRDGSKRFMKSGAVGRGGGDYQNKRRDGNDGDSRQGGGYQGRRDRAHGGGNREGGNRGNYANKRDGDNRRSDKDGEHSVKQTDAKSVWGKPAAPAAAPNAWGTK